MTTWPVLDFPPVHPDDWLSSYWDVYPFGRSAAAKTAMAAATRAVRPASGPRYGGGAYAAGSVIRSSTGSLPYATKTAGVWDFGDTPLVIYGGTDWSGISARARRVIIANRWFDPTVAGQSGRTLGDRPPFHELDPRDTFGAPSCALDFEEVLLLGVGVDASQVNEFGKAWQVQIAGSPSSGAQIKLRLTYNIYAASADDPRSDHPTGTDTVDTSVITAPFTFAKLRAALADMTSTLVSRSAEGSGSGTHNEHLGGWSAKGHPQVDAFGSQTNGPWTIDTNDQVSEASFDAGHVDTSVTDLQVVTVSGSGFSGSVTRVDSNMNNAKGVQLNGATQLARLSSDPRGSTYPSGIHRFAVMWRQSDTFGLDPTGALTLWHYADFGQHPDRYATFGGGHNDVHQLGQAAVDMLGSKLPLHRFFAWTISSSGLFLQTPTGVQDYLIARDGLIRFRGSGSKPMDLSGSNVKRSGLSNVYVDEYARDPNSEAWTGQTSGDRADGGDYYSVSGVTSYVLDSYKRWDEASSSYVAVPVSQQSAARIAQPSDLVLPAVPAEPAAALPSITSLAPPSGPVGATITINGANLASATRVRFNGTAAAISSNTDTQIIVVVPAAATSGPVSVTTSGGTVTSAASFTVTPTPPPAAVQQVGGVVTGSHPAADATLTATVPSGGYAAGVRLLLVVGAAADATENLQTVTDGHVNGYVITEQATGGGTNNRLWLVEANLSVPLAAGDTITATFAGTPSRKSLVGCAFTGLIGQVPSVEPGTLASDTAATTAIALTSAGPVGDANDLALVALLVTTGAATSIAGFAPPSGWQAFEANSGSTGQNRSTVLAFKTPAGSGAPSFSAAQTNANQWAGIVVALATGPVAKAAADASGVAPSTFAEVAQLTRPLSASDASGVAPTTLAEAAVAAATMTVAEPLGAISFAETAQLDRQQLVSDAAVQSGDVDAASIVVQVGASDAGSVVEGPTVAAGVAASDAAAGDDELLNPGAPVFVTETAGANEQSVAVGNQASADTAAATAETAIPPAQATAPTASDAAAAAETSGTSSAAAASDTSAATTAAAATSAAAATDAATATSSGTAAAAATRSDAATGSEAAGASSTTATPAASDSITANEALSQQVEFPLGASDAIGQDVFIDFSQRVEAIVWKTGADPSQLVAPFAPAYPNDLSYPGDESYPGGGEWWDTPATPGPSATENPPLVATSAAETSTATDAAGAAMTISQAAADATAASDHAASIENPASDTAATTETPSIGPAAADTAAASAAAATSSTSTRGDAAAASEPAPSIGVDVHAAEGFATTDTASSAETGRLVASADTADGVSEQAATLGGMQAADAGGVDNTLLEQPLIGVQAADATPTSVDALFELLVLYDLADAVTITQRAIVDLAVAQEAYGMLVERVDELDVTRFVNRLMFDARRPRARPAAYDARTPA